MTELEVASAGQVIDSTPFVEFEPTGLSFQEDTPFEVWRVVTDRLFQADQALQWWIGDAVTFGEGCYGERYSQALESTDYDYSHLATMAWVSRQYEISLRSEILTWSHHRLVAPMESDERQYWLELAEQGDENEKTGERKPWSVAKLKGKINAKKQRQKLEESQGEAQAPKLYNVPAMALIDSLEDRSVDVFITDPPYSTDVDDLPSFIEEWLYPALNLVKDTGRAFICTGNYPHEVEEYLRRLLAYERFVFGNVLVWTYRNTMGPAPSHLFKNNWQAIFYLHGKNADPLNTESLNEKFSVLDIAAPDGRHGNRYHEWQKPDELAERLIRLSSKPGELIVDPFCGTGTFCLEAGRMGRRAVGTDVDRDALGIAAELGAEVVYAS